MSKIKNGGLDQYGAEPLEQQQLGTAGVKGVKSQSPFLMHILQCQSIKGTVNASIPIIN